MPSFHSKPLEPVLAAFWWNRGQSPEMNSWTFGSRTSPSATVGDDDMPVGGLAIAGSVGSSIRATSCTAGRRTACTAPAAWLVAEVCTQAIPAATPEVERIGNPRSTQTESAAVGRAVSMSHSRPAVVPTTTS